MNHPIFFGIEEGEYRVFFQRHHYLREGKLKKGRALLCAAVLFACLMWTALGAAADGRTYLAADAGYRSGDFGTDTTFRLIHLTPSIGFVSDTWQASLSIPTLTLQADGELGKQTASGIGDILIQASRRLVSEKSTGIQVDGSVAVKMPTADETKGLGTGGTDYSAFILLKKSYGTIAFMAQAGYIVRGDASIQTYNDTPMYAVGISKSFNRSQLAAVYENDGAFVDGADTARSIAVSGFHVLSPQYAVRGSLLIGVSDGAEDIGASIGFVRWF